MGEPHRSTHQVAQGAVGDGYGTHYQPYGKKDGRITVKIHLNKRMRGQIAANRARWENSGNSGKSEEEMIALWNEAHPDDPIEE